MPRGCSALHGVNPNLKKKTKNKKTKNVISDLMVKKLIERSMRKNCTEQKSTII